MATPSALTAETSQPQERFDQDLPPKTYADATFLPEEQQREENKQSHTQNTAVKIDSRGTSAKVTGIPLAPASESESAPAPDAVHVGTKSPSEADWLKPSKDGRKSLHNNTSELDGSRTTKTDAVPTTNGTTMGDNRENHGALATNMANGVSELSPENNTSYEAMIQSIKPTKHAEVDGHSPKANRNQIVQETDQNGSTLTSVKPDRRYEEGLQHDAEIAKSDKKKKSTAQDTSASTSKSKSHLASGRRAGAGWERSAIRYAPLNVPVQRRLQTLAVLWHTTAMGTFLTVFFLVCAVPLAWPLLVPYLIYTLMFSTAATSGSLARRNNWMRRSKFWSLFAGYFPARLYRTVELEPTRKYIFGYHPHGIISHGAFAAFATEALGFSDLFPGITNTLLTLESNFRLPFYRDYLLAMGLASVSGESVTNILTTGGIDGAGMGRACTIVIGGARESLDAKPGTLRLVLKKRKGFIKIAIRTGADLVPVLAFGENELYNQVDSESHPSVHRMQLRVKNSLGFTLPLFHARGVFNYDFGLMPYRRPINVVVGRPIKVVQQGADGGRVDEKYLDQLHEEYIQQLTLLWKTHKDKFAGERITDLEITE